MIYIVTKRNEKGYSELVKAFKSAHIARQYVLDHNNSSWQDGENYTFTVEAMHLDGVHHQTPIRGVDQLCL